MKIEHMGIGNDVEHMAIVGHVEFKAAPASLVEDAVTETPVDPVEADAPETEPKKRGRPRKESNS